MRKILVTAALPYANGELHLGHLKSTYLPADIYVRYHRLKGNDVVYVCGSDEHGTPIELEAKRSGKPVLEYTSYWRERHLEDFKKMRISFDEFYRTHSEENIELTRMFLVELRKKGYLYKQKVKQLYCPYDDMYLADRFVVGECPYCGAQNQYGDYCEKCGRTYNAWELKNPRCILCGRKPEIREDEHFFFRLSAFADKLRNWLLSNNRLQRSVVNYLLKWLDDLKDWDITRDRYWGIPMPFEDARDKYVYVWFDAPIGYIAATVKWCREHGRSWEEYWKNSEAEIVHLIGKDIVYHHFLFWPAMLMGVNEGLQLPSMISVRGFLTLEGRKFSKSRKWYVSISEMASIFEPDYVRFYLTLISPHSLEDTDFSLNDFKEAVNSGLSDTIGNLVNRVVTLIHRRFKGVVPAPGGLDDLDKEIVSAIEELPAKVGGHVEKLDLKTGLEELLAFARMVNKYLNEKEPWRSSEEKAAATLSVALRAVYTLAALLYPFTPEISSRILSVIGMELPPWDEAGKKWVPEGHRLGKPKIVAPRITDESIEKIRKVLAERSGVKI